MREFIEDYGEFLVLSIIVTAAIAVFVGVGRIIGAADFLG